MLTLGERIKVAQVNETVDLHDLNLWISDVCFDQDIDGYSWCAHDADQTWRTVFPTKGQWVVFFKTLAGAKRNFLRRYDK